jgi:ubiquinone/menaquinone biosynthesis C-methylase UbiE/thiamine kinase-like enzyme
MIKKEVYTLKNAVEENSVFCCPTCSSLLQKTENRFFCESCDIKFPVRDNIPMFGRDPDFFTWGIPKEKMESTLAHIKEKGWQDSVLKLQEDLPHCARRIWSRIFNPRRWPWIFLLPISPESRVLDLGSGWGNNAINIAPYCKEVYAIDTTLLYLEWLKAYASEQKIPNIIPVHGGSSPHLPFQDNYFDAVVMNGVLEWIGESFPGDPQKSQQMILNDVSRILKPDGCLYIGIENRINYKYFLGGTEGHTGMKFSSLLPRYITKILLKALRNKDFKVYTYSMPGYRNMLKKAGLGFTSFLAPVPNYSRISKFMPICNVSKKKSFEPLSFDYSNKRQKFLMNLGGAHFVSSFSIFASAEPLRKNLLVEAVNRILRSAFGEEFNSKSKVTLFKVKEKSAGRFVFRINLYKKGRWFLKIDTAKDDAVNIIKSVDVISNIKDNENIPAGFKDLLPEVIKYGKLDCFGYLLEEEAKGLPGEMLVRDVHARKDLIREAMSVLKTLHKNTASRQKIDDALFDEYFRKPILGIQKWMKKEEREEYKDWFKNIEMRFYRDLINKDLCLVCRHGDFVPNNCIIDPASKRIITILDWEYAEEKGLPLLDVVSFLNRAFRPEMKKKYPGVKFPGYPNEFLSNSIKDIAYDYLKNIGVPKDIYRHLVFMWWVKYLEACYPIYRYQAEFRKKAIYPVIEAWGRLLAS